MTRRCRSCAPAAAPPSRGGYGRTCAMIGRRAVSILQRCSSATARIAKVSGLERTWRTLPACYRPMPMPASIASMASGSRRRPVGRTCGASFTTSMRSAFLPGRAWRPSSGSGDCTKSKRRSAVAHRMPEPPRSAPGARAGPELKSLHEWLQRTATALSKKSELAKAIRYALLNWVALTRYCEDGRLEIDNNAAEARFARRRLGAQELNRCSLGPTTAGARRGNLHTPRHRETQRSQPRKLPALRPSRAHRRDHPINQIGRTAALEPARQDAWSFESQLDQPVNAACGGRLHSEPV